jgi:hypothetical protein
VDDDITNLFGVEPIFDLDEDQFSAALYNQVNVTCREAPAAYQNAIAT